MMEYKSLRENSTTILEREIKSQGVILEANVAGQGWSSRLFTVCFVDSNMGVEIFSKKMG